MGFNLPEELLLSLNDAIPCRELQIRQLHALLGNPSTCLPTLIIHGPEASGKSLTTSTLLDTLPITSVLIRSQECITTRHLLERTIAHVKRAFSYADEEDIASTIDSRCESISTFVVRLQQLLEGRERFILVFDGIDQQRDAAPTLLAAIARLGEAISNLTVLLIVTTPRPRLLPHANIPHQFIPPYNRAASLSIVSRVPSQTLSLTGRSTSQSIPSKDPPISEDDSTWLWSQFCGAVWDSFGQGAARDISSFRATCERLWKPFLKPVLDGTYNPRDFSRLMVRNRGLFQSEGALMDEVIPSVLSKVPTETPTSRSQPKRKEQPLLPFYPAYLLIAAYLASHTQTRHDTALFSKASFAKKRRRKTGALTIPTSQRTIARKLAGSHPFPLERLLAIFHAILPQDVRGGGADVMMQIATLRELRLLVRAGAGGDMLDGGKWRCAVGWDFVRGVARGVVCEIEDWIVE